jgi:hypothetical protein
MKRQLISSAFVVFLLLCLQSCAQKPDANGNLHGGQQALSESNLEGSLQTLCLDITDKDGILSEMELRKINHDYELTYRKGEERNIKSLDEDEALKLQNMLEEHYKQPYYQDNWSEKGEESPTWQLDIQHEKGAFSMKGRGCAPEDYPIIKAVKAYYDDLFEYTLPDIPFPEGKLKHFRFSHKESMSPGGPEWTVDRLDDGRYKISYLNDAGLFENENPVKKEMVGGKEVGEKLCEIFRKGNVQTYKHNYLFSLVTDGSQWSFEAEFDNRESVSSSGYEDWPRDRSGITDATKYLSGLLGVDE